MRRRRLTHVCLLITLLAWTPGAAAKPASSWAQAELKTAVAAGLMAKAAAARPNDPLTRDTEIGQFRSAAFAMYEWPTIFTAPFDVMRANACPKMCRILLRLAAPCHQFHRLVPAKWAFGSPVVFYKKPSVQ